MLPRKLYNDILLVGFLIVVVCHCLYWLLPEFSTTCIPIRYIKDFKYFLMFLIVFYEALQADNVIKGICLFLFPVVFIATLLMIMHWPFGTLIFLVSTLSMLVLLAVSVITSGLETTLRMLLLAYPLIMVILGRIFFPHQKSLFWIVDLSMILIIVIALIIKRITSFEKNKQNAQAE